MVLPTYEEAVSGPSALALAAPLLDGAALSACCTVSKEFNTLFSPFLWASPIKILAGRQLPFSKTYMFMKSAKKVRLEMRYLVTTFDFRPLMVLRSTRSHQLDYQMYENVLTGSWFCCHAPWFPNLRFVILDGLSGFDINDPELSQSIVGPVPRILDHARITETSSDELEAVAGDPAAKWESIQPLLLSTADCYTLDSTLALISPCMSGLMYLDISGTIRIEDWTRAFSNIQMQNLRILKLRGMRLTDRLLPTIATRTDRKLWSLDIRNNLLTDTTIDNLLGSCFLPRIIQPLPNKMNVHDEKFYEDVPSYQRSASTSETHTPDGTMPLRPDAPATFIQYLELNGHSTSSDGFTLDEKDDMMKSTGLTHLYLAGNKFTSSGIRNLIRGSNRLQVLDVGSVRASLARKDSGPYTNIYGQFDSTAPLCRSSGTRLEDLRIHHSIVTYAPTITGAEAPAAYSRSFLEQAEAVQAPQQKRCWRAFTPNANCRLKMLTLTGIPTKSLGPTIDRLEEFLNLCADQEKDIKKAREGAGPTHHRSPPLLTGLRTLRLEFLPEADSPQSPTGGGSVSGDRDADTFLAQSSSDFSFFTEPKRSKIRRGSATGVVSPVKAGSNPESITYRDVVKELKTFRQKEPKWGGRLELVLRGQT